MKENSESRDEGFADFFEHLPVGIYRNTAGEEGSFQMVNREMVEIFEAESKEELLEHSVASLYRDPEQREEFSDKLQENRVVEREVLDLETLKGRGIKCAITAIKKGDSEGETYFDGIVEDVTEEERRRRKLKEQNEFYSSIFSESNDAIFIIQDGVFEEVNQEFADLLETSKEDLEGEGYTEYVAPEHREKVEERYRKRLRGEEPPTGYRVNLSTETGGRIPIELNPALIPYEGETATLGIARDVSERIEKDKQLGVLDRVFRHNLRNQMNLLQGRLDALEPGEEVEEAELSEMREVVSRVLSHSQKAHEMIDTVLENPSPQELELTDVVRQRVEDLEGEHPEAGVSLSAPEEVRVEAVPEIEKAVGELLMNAVEHNTADRPLIGVEIESHEERAILSVSDNAPKIPEDEVEVLTERDRIDPLYHGSGLGLWLINWIVKHSEGSVEFQTHETGNNIKVILGRSGSSG